MKNKTYYKVTKFGKEYAQTRAKTMRGVVDAFEACFSDVYEIENPNGLGSKQYVGNELTYQQRIDILIADGFVVKL